MTFDSPTYPRLHLTDTFETGSDSTRPTTEFESLFDAFERATGWRLTVEQAVGQQRLGSVLDLPPIGERRQAAPMPLAEAQQLADGLGALVSELQQTRTEIRNREADLAAAVPVTRHRHEEEHLAARLEAILRTGAECVGCQAAGLYVLDETTSELKLRAAWGLPGERLLEAARPLKNSLADLEALVGNAVILEDAAPQPHWNVPESYPAAMCLPVSSPTDPLGTLWLFAESRRSFSDRETATAELVAGRLAAELQREALLRECLSAKQFHRQMLHAAHWQHDHLPTIQPIVEGWRIAGWSAADEAPVAGFYDWFVPPDGSLAIGFGECEGLKLEATLGGVALQASLRAHASHPADPAAVVQRVNEDIWNASAGGHFASLFYALLRDDCGEVRYAMAGNVQALVVDNQGWRLLSGRQSALGSEPELSRRTHAVQLRAGEFLILVSSALQGSFNELAETIADISHRQPLDNDSLVQQFRRSLPHAELGLIVRRTD